MKAEPMSADQPSRSNAFSSISQPARVALIGAGTARIADALREALSAHTVVECLEGCRGLLNPTPGRGWDLILLDVAEGGDRLAVAAGAARRANPRVALLLLASGDSLDTMRTALKLRCDDLLLMPMDCGELAQRLQAALARSLAARLADEKLALLEGVCERLLADRDELARKVGGLCGDLASAHERSSEQATIAGRVGELRALLSQETERESTVRTAMQYLLSVTGPMNTAVFLPTADGSWTLAGYAREDTPRNRLTVEMDEFRARWCGELAGAPAVVRVEGVVTNPQWQPLAALLPGRDIIGWSCPSPERAEAILIGFRATQRPFDAAAIEVLDALREVIGCALQRLDRIHRRARPTWPAGASDCNEAGD